MSADSPSRSRSQNKVNVGPLTVTPQQVTDPTILDSVAGFISDVVPTTYNLPCDTKDQIQWAHFEQLDYDETFFSPKYECDKIIPSPLVLVLGYTNGVQVWAVPASGEAVELLSWRHGSVKILKFLPAPYIIGKNGFTDLFATKRPLIALCDSSAPGPHSGSLSFISLKGGEQVKLIKFKNPIIDVLANNRSVVVTFNERIAIFDAFTLEDRLTVTTCFVSPGLNPNPIALSTRWMAYAENKFLPSRRSAGGNEGEGVQSYTATVLQAAKSLGRGLRELGETVASSLTGNSHTKPGSSSGMGHGNNQTDILQKGVVTILDIESQSIDTTEKKHQSNAVISHFMAHTEAIVYLAFDPSGMLLLTADKRGHDFHLFRIHPHPAGSALASVHHLYILHRGDTSARVQDMCYSPDSRWVTVSTIRGTTHVFPITPYGGNVGIRTHATPHVVNRMSRFHRSAGLTPEGRSNSPVSLFEMPVNSNIPFHNPRLPPFPHPTVVHPLAQIRQPVYTQSNNSAQQRQVQGRQRLSSSSEDNLQVALRVCSFFAPPRAWLDSLTPTRDLALSKQQAKPVESLFIMSCHGSLIQYDLEPRPIGSMPKERICDDTPIELHVSAKAQWILQRQPNGIDIQLPLTLDNLNLVTHEISPFKHNKPNHNDDQWLSQVEIVTHAGPHRRLWMGPQFTFKTYNTTSGSLMNIIDSQAIDIGRSKPVNMPLSSTHPIMIESGSVSSCEPSPKLLDTYQKNFDDVSGAGELQLKEDLADAMLESPGIRDNGGRCVIVSVKQHTTGVAKVVNPLGTVVTVQSDDDYEVEVPEDIIIHENCDEALFRPVVASKALLFSEPKIITNALPVTQTAIVETPFLLGGKSSNSSKVLSNFNNKKCATNNKNNFNDKSALKTSKRIDKKLQNEAIKLNKSNTNKQLTNDECDFDTKPTSISNSTKLQTYDFSDPFDDVSLKKSDCFIEFDYSTSNNKDMINNTEVQSSSKNKLDSDNLLLAEDTNIWNEMSYEYTLDENEKQFSKDILNLEIASSKTKTDKYQELEKDDDKKEDKYNKRVRKPKPKIGVKVTKNEIVEPIKSDDEPIECTFTLKKTWSSIAASKPKDDLISVDEITEKTEKLDKSETNLIDHQQIDNSDISDMNLLKIYNKSDDEKQENGSHSETTESDDSSKVVQLIAMDTEEDAYQSESKNNDLQAVASKSNGKKKPKKKRGGEQSAECVYRDNEDFSSASSFSSASRASPTPSYSGDNLLHFPGDSSSSL